MMDNRALTKVGRPFAAFAGLCLLLVLCSGCGPNLPTAEHYYDEGSELYEQERYAESVGQFSEAIAIDEGYALAYGGRGMAYIELDEYQLALDDFEQAISLDPE